MNSSATAGQGNPNGAVFAPGEADTCFQGSGDDAAGSKGGKVSAAGPYGGCWFFNPTMHPKSLHELVSSYHDSVGKNAFWLLDWTPNQTGVLLPNHIQRYAEFGTWITECYSTAVVESTNFTTGICSVQNRFEESHLKLRPSAPARKSYKRFHGKPAELTPCGAGNGGPATTLTVPVGHEVDRIVLRENLVDGQLIQGFTVTASFTNGANEGSHEQVVAVQGSSIGNKFIGMLDKVYSAGTTLKFQVTASAHGASMVSAAAYNCSRTPQASGCGYQQDFAYKVVKSITLKTILHSTNAACCAACRADNDCAVFVVSPPPSKTCSVLSANQGGDTLKGAVSGTPKR